MNVPQCAFCILADAQPGLPANRTDLPEPGGYHCAVTAEFISEGQEPLEGECSYLTGIVGYLAREPHPLEAALAADDHEAVVSWLIENVPSDDLLCAALPNITTGADHRSRNARPTMRDGKTEG